MQNSMIKVKVINATPLLGDDNKPVQGTWRYQIQIDQSRNDGWMWDFTTNQWVVHESYWDTYIANGRIGGDMGDAMPKVIFDYKNGRNALIGYDGYSRQWLPDMDYGLNEKIQKAVEEFMAESLQAS